MLVLIPGTLKEDWKGSQIKCHCPYFQDETKEAQGTCQSCQSHINVKQLEEYLTHSKQTYYLNY